MSERKAHIKRATRETQIEVKLDVDGTGMSSISTGIPFFDHMLTLFAKHSVVNLTLKCKGDLEIDAHHTVEDCGIALGQAFHQALGNKAGIRRYGQNVNDKVSAKSAKNASKSEAFVPMDETLTRCVIDFS